MVLPLTGLPAIGELPTQNQMVEHQKTALLNGVLARLGIGTCSKGWWAVK